MVPLEYLDYTMFSTDRICESFSYLDGAGLITETLVGGHGYIQNL